MRFQRIDLLLQQLVLSALLAFSCASAWAASGTCTYNKPVTAIEDARIGGTGMGGTGVISKGTGIGGTGISPETGTGTMQLAGLVIDSQGSVEAKSNEQTRKLAKGDPVCVGETIVTSQTGRLQIKMSDDGLISLRPKTQIKIEKFAYSGTAEDTSIFALIKGASRFVTGKIGKRNPQNDLVRTQSATIGVRGTDHEVMVILPGDGSVYPSGTYDKVNTGVTFIRTDIGEIDIHPDQVGLATSREELPTLLKDIPDFYIIAPPIKEGDLTENIREGSSPEHSGKEIELDHPSEFEKSSGAHTGDRIDMDRPESHAPVIPESIEIPEIHETIEVPELPETIEPPEIPQSMEIPEIPERPEN